MKRVYKDPENGKICGVCAGLAEYFGIDVSLVRVIWAVLAFTGGFGAIPYLICAVILPPKNEVL